MEALGRALQRLGRHKKVLLTLGAEGMACFPPRGPVERLPTYATEVVDVTGAGDAVSSVAVLGNILGWDLGSVAWAASQAAAIAIAHVGTHHVSRRELEERIGGSGS
jgi:bifunctional ADP-heptose synthase (sugar kinase/adenylyltransferase)